MTTETPRRVLVFLPTYNEAGTVEKIYSMIRDSLAEADILFIDDSSPDGTGEILDRMAAADDRLDPHHVSFLHMFHVAADGTDHSSYFMAGDSAEGDSLIPSNVV